MNKRQSNSDRTLCHLIEKVIIQPEGQVIVHKAECPACLAGIPPKDFTYGSRQSRN